MLSSDYEIDSSVINQDFRIPNNLTFTFENKLIDKKVFLKLAGEVNSPIVIQVRKHKKKRINKKWAKRYGYKFELVR